MSRHVREELILCVCGWTGRGYGGDPCPRCGSTERAQIRRVEIHDGVVTVDGIPTRPAQPATFGKHVNTKEGAARRKARRR